MQSSDAGPAGIPPNTLSQVGSDDTDSRKMQGRYTEVDVFRGIAVVGVVFAHTAQGLEASGLLNGDSLLFTINAWMLQFRMPAIALVIGLFTPHGISKYGGRGYVRRRVIFATYLYALWYTLQMSLELAASPVKNNPVTIRDVLTFWETDAQLWFIPYIAVAAVVLSLIRPWENWTFLSLLALMSLSVYVWGWQTDTVGLRGLCLIGFTALGSVIGIKRFGSWLRNHKALIMWMGVAAVGVSMFFIGEVMVPTTAPADPEIWQAGRITWLPRSVFVSYLGLVVLAAVAIVLSKVPVLGASLRYMGTQTLPIYLAHVVLVATARILLIKIGFNDGAILLPTLVMIGIGGPLALNYVAVKLGMRWVFDVPSGWLPKRIPDSSQVRV